MKGILVSDWHLDVFTVGVDRYDDVCQSIDASVDAAIEMKADFYLMCGDLADPNTARAHRAVVKAVAVERLLGNEGIPSFFVAGNHDVIEDGSGITTLSPVAATGGDGLVFETPQIVDMGDYVIIGLPFVEAAHDYDADQFIRQCADGDWGPTKGKFVLIAGHLSLSGIHAGSETTDMARGRKSLWPVEAIQECFPSALVVGGHYHTPQEFNGIHIIGSLARLRFDERDNSPGYMVVET